jgi:predicted permease
MTDRSRATPVVVAVYRAMLRLYPRRAQRFGDDQLDLFVQVLREEWPASRLRRPFWLGALFARGVVAGCWLHWDEMRDAARSRRSRPARGFPWRTLMTDVRHALRSLRRAPWHAAGTTAVVALGVALAATVFALVDGVLFKPLPYRAPHEVFALRGTARGVDPIDTRSASPREVREWRSAVPEIAISSSSTPLGYGTLGVINGPTVWSRAVDAHFWDVVGRRPMIGDFAPSDFDADLPTKPAIISYALWQRLFGGDATVVGRRIEAGRITLRVAGVLPRDFVFPSMERQAVPDILHPMVLPPEAFQSGSRYLAVIARVPSGVPHESVVPRLERAAQSAGAPEGRGRAFDAVTLTPLGEIMAMQERTSAALAFSAVALMVALVAVNVGGLIASRAQDRARESAARLALGATWVDLARLYLIEIGVLTLAGAAIGLAAAQLLLSETARRLPANVLLLRPPEIDVRVVMAVLVATSVVALVATAIALSSTNRRSLTPILGQGAGATTARQRSSGRFVLQAGQVALAITLVIGGALFVTSLARVWNQDAGFTLDDTMYVEVRLGSPPAGGDGNSATQVLELLELVRRTPGVDRATVIDAILLERARRGSTLQPVGGPVNMLFGDLIPVASGYFQMAGLRPIEGRLPSDEEMDAGAPVAVVSERTAREYWPGRTAIGQTLTSKRVSVTVVGVVKDARFRALDLESQGEIYAPLRLGFYSTVSANYLVQSAPADDRVLSAVLGTIRRYDGAASVRRAQDVSVALADSIKQRRFHAWLFSVLAASGLLIAGAGIFGLIAGATGRRTREIGIRLALGSTPDRIVRLLVREQLAPVFAGIAAGAAVAAWAARYLSSLLYQVSAYDLSVWLSSAAIVISVALTGAMIPALRASRSDPVSVLRQ